MKKLEQQNSEQQTNPDGCEKPAALPTQRASVREVHDRKLRQEKLKDHASQEQTNPGRIDEPVGNPMRPPSAFIYYKNDQYKLLKDAGFKIDTNANTDIARSWKTLGANEKANYQKKFTLALEEYRKTKANTTKPCRATYARIGLQSITSLVNKFSQEQRDAVSSIGFGGLLSLKCRQLDHNLCQWLIESFDPISHSLRVHGREYPLTTSVVKDLMGLPCTGVDVNLKGSLKEDKELCQQLEVGVERGVISLPGLKNYLEKLRNDAENAGEDFQRRFALFILGAFLCPTTKSAIRPSFIHAVKDVNCMKDTNWAKLTLESLVSGIIKVHHHKQSGATGCLFLLELFYLDRIATDLGFGASSGVSPRLAFWDDSQMKKTKKKLMDLGVYMRNTGHDKFYGNTSDAPTFKEGGAGYGGGDVRFANLEKEVADIHVLLRQLVAASGGSDVFAKLVTLLEGIQGVVPSPKGRGPMNERCDDGRLTKLEKEIDEMKDLLRQYMPAVGRHLVQPDGVRDAQVAHIQETNPNVGGENNDVDVDSRPPGKQAEVAPVVEGAGFSAHQGKTKTNSCTGNESSLPPPRYGSVSEKTQKLKRKQTEVPDAEVQSVARTTRAHAARLPQDLPKPSPVQARPKAVVSSSSTFSRHNTRGTNERKPSFIYHSPYVAEKLPKTAPKKSKLGKNNKRSHVEHFLSASTSRVNPHVATKSSQEICYEPPSPLMEFDEGYVNYVFDGDMPDKL